MLSGNVPSRSTIREPVIAGLAFRYTIDAATARLQARCQGALVSEAQLTLRQAEVLSLVARGWTNRRIGRALGITERTVRKHLTNACEKLGDTDTDVVPARPRGTHRVTASPLSRPMAKPTSSAR